MISEEYRHLLQELRVSRPHWGSTGHRYGEQVSNFARDVQAKTILDFGCGNCSLKDTLARELHYFPYDPAINGLDTLPDDNFDLICAIDVLEHVEIECIPQVLDYIHAHSLKGVWLLISTVPANQSLPDGRNAHITCKPAAWWGMTLGAYDWGQYSIDVSENSIIFTARKC